MKKSHTSPTKLHTKERHHKTTKQSPSKEQIARTLSTPQKASNTSLHRMHETLMDMVMEKQPQSTEERKGLLDALVAQLVNTRLFSLLPSGSSFTRQEIVFNAYQV
jgi:hypothetical protein